jgi:hypothetical protein
MAVQVVTEAPRRQRLEVMPRVQEVVVLLGAELAAPDGRSLGRLREVGLDHFGHLSALVGPRGAYAAAGIREVSRNGAAVVVDPAVPLRRTVHRRVGRDTPSWTTDDTDLQVLGLRMDASSRRMTSLLVRRRRGKVRDLPWGMVHFETDGLPLAAYWNGREDLPVTHPVPRARRWQLGSKPCPVLRQGGVSGPGTGG